MGTATQIFKLRVIECILLLGFESQLIAKKLSQFTVEPFFHTKTYFMTCLTGVLNLLTNFINIYM